MTVTQASDDPMGKAQRQGLWEDNEYVAHKIASTATYPSSYINTVKEGGSCEGGATAPLAPPIPTPLLHNTFCIHCTYTWFISTNKIVIRVLFYQ